MSLIRKKLVPGSVRELLNVSIPVIISQASSSLMMFTDRFVLTALGREYPAASMSGGFTSFLLVIFFVGLLTYINPLVAQHIGANKEDQCPKIVSQGLFVAMLTAPFFLWGGFSFVPIYFAWAGTPPTEMSLALDYFNIIHWGSFFVVVNSVFSSFFAGLERTRVVMIVNFLGMLVNIPLTYFLVHNGIGGQYLGVEGAALATVISTVLMTVVSLFFYLGPTNRLRFKRLNLGVFDRHILIKLMRYGLPSGLEFLLVFAAFNTFVVLFHSYGVNEALAMTIVFNWDILVFLPIWGLNIGLMSLVGKYMGARQVDLALKSTYSGAKLAYAIVLIAVSGFFLNPEPMVRIFLPQVSSEITAEILSLTTTMLRIVSLYLLANTTSMVLGATLRASGDTRWCMFISIVAHWVNLVLSYVGIKVMGWGPVVTWSCFAGSLFLEAVLFFWRFQLGQWKKMQIV